MSETEETLFRRTPWHVYPPGWQDSYWVIPFNGDNAVIHHGHNSASDHSLCGPMLFCCAKSQRSFVENFPDNIPAQANWQLTDAKHVVSWLDAGVSHLYFIFCDPVRPDGLLAGGLSGEQALQAVLKKMPLEMFAENATRIR